MPFEALPQYAAWRHRDARDGFEVVFARSDHDGWELEGGTAAVEGDEGWCVRYLLRLTREWRTRSARVWGNASSGRFESTIEADGAGRWLIDGQPAPHLEGCLDVDLESSALTNAFPVHRLALAVGQQASAPAAYVRALDLTVERLEQRYHRLSDDGRGERYGYTAPGFQFECELVYDKHGLVIDYPGIAIRAA